MSRSMFRLPALCLLGGLLVSGAQAADTVTSQNAPELTTVRAAIKAKNFDAALAELKSMVVKYQNSGVYSLLGFALRKTGDKQQAMTYYRKALDADPAHKGALEYQGELFLEIGQPAKARANMTKLERLCPTGCEELEDLRDAIAHASPAKGS